MKKFTFILGHSPALAAWEISKILNNFITDFKIELVNKTLALVTANQELDYQKLMGILGGTKKIGRINKEFSQFDEQQIFNYLEKLLLQNQAEARLQFGFSLYFYNFDSAKQNLWQKKFLTIGLKLKRQVKNNFKHCRLLVSRELDLSAVIIDKEKLLTQGYDLQVIITPEKIYLGQTMAYQNYQDFSRRDYGRPKRDALAGMLPVKLAKILINLAQVKSHEVILDPFCGSGTILQEAMLLGYRHLIGNDNNPLAIKNCENNLQWLQNKYQLNSKEYRFKLMTADVKNLATTISPQSLSAIITEPYLGSPLRSQSVYQERLNEKKKLEQLYYQAFIVFKQILKPAGKLVIIWPAWRFLQKKLSTTPTPIIFLSDQLLGNIQELGFRQIKPDNIFKKCPDFKDYLTERNSVLYWRPDQRVAREVFIFEKN